MTTDWINLPEQRDGGRVLPEHVIQLQDALGTSEQELADHEARLTEAEEREPEAWSDFRNAVDGQPAALDSGQAWRHVANSGEDDELRVVDGALTNEVVSGATAGYAEAHLSGTVTRIGAKITFGSFSGSVHTAVLAILAQPFDNDAIGDMSCHLTFGPTGYVYAIWDADDGFVAVQARDFDTPLTADGATEHLIEVQIIGNIATILVSGGVVGRVIDDRIATHGGAYCFWEVYATNAATDSKPSFREVWADSRIESFRATGASAATLAEAVLGRSTTVARQYNDTDADVTLTGTMAELNEALRCPFIFPPSGKLLIDFTGYLVATSGTAVILGMFYDEALVTSAGTHWITKGNTVYDGNFHVSRIIEFPPGTSGTLYIGAWRVSGNATVYLGVNNPAVLKVTSL